MRDLVAIMRQAICEPVLSFSFSFIHRSPAHHAAPDPDTTLPTPLSLRRCSPVKILKDALGEGLPALRIGSEDLSAGSRRLGMAEPEAGPSAMPAAPSVAASPAESSESSDDDSDASVGCEQSGASADENDVVGLESDGESENEQDGARSDSDSENGDGSDSETAW